MIVWVISFSMNGIELSKMIKDHFMEWECRIFSKTSSNPKDTEVVSDLGEWMGQAFAECDAIISIGAVGIAVRHIAPHIRSKVTDPAVICIDDRGTFTIPILSGHIGGANDMAREISARIGSVPVITTATDINGRISIDSFAEKNQMHISSMEIAKEVSSRVLDGRFVGIYSDMEITNVPKELTYSESGEVGVSITFNSKNGPFDRTLKLVPKVCVLGIGCRRGTAEERISTAVKSVLDEYMISEYSVRAVASIDLKKDESGLLEFSRSMGIEPVFYTSDELNSLDMEFSVSEFVRKTTGVDCICERSALLASENGRLIVGKQVFDGVTVAVAVDDCSFDMSK